VNELMANDNSPQDPIERSSKSKDDSSKNSVNSLFNLLDEQISKIDHGTSKDIQTNESELSAKEATDTQTTLVSPVSGEGPKMVLEKFEQLDRQDGTTSPFIMILTWKHGGFSARLGEKGLVQLTAARNSMRMSCIPGKRKWSCMPGLMSETLFKNIGNNKKLGPEYYFCLVFSY
jgi:hypothetical protein